MSLSTGGDRGFDDYAVYMYVQEDRKERSWSGRLRVYIISTPHGPNMPKWEIPAEWQRSPEI